MAGGNRAYSDGVQRDMKRIRRLARLGPAALAVAALAACSSGQPNTEPGSSDPASVAESSLPPPPRSNSAGPSEAAGDPVARDTTVELLLASGSAAEGGDGALIAGSLSIVEDCVAVESPSGDTWLLVWPPGTTVVNGTIETVLAKYELGAQVSLGGGEIEVSRIRTVVGDESQSHASMCSADERFSRAFLASSS